MNQPATSQDMQATNTRLDAALRIAADCLRHARHPDGYWEGYLSSSALSTATAVSALALAGHDEDAASVRAGVTWLARTQNGDGGWGDTPDSPSNLATTLLAVSALILAGEAMGGGTCQRANAYITSHAGDSPSRRRAAILRQYGDDRTFAVPILMNCALAGLVPWEGIPALPFELAVFPHGWYKLLRLHVVSYALPALIAIGLLLGTKEPVRNPCTRFIRRRVAPAVLAKLERLQPESGGFLEATPLTAFVAMSLLARGDAGAVVQRSLHFLRASMRADGSWPIDTNLSVWLTTGAVTALVCANHLPGDETRTWIAARQYRCAHPFTHAVPGGWGWTHLSGGVPDADDTAGALIALQAWGESDGLETGVRWLLQLQNRDGGWPTFCKGWGQLPFDKSSPDVTAHALRALHAVAGQPGYAIRLALRRGYAFLASVQRDDGAWIPLWFGHQQAPGQANAVFGTARVLPAFANQYNDGEPARRGLAYLLGAQNSDGGWGGDRGIASSVEETALAVSALTRFWERAGVVHALMRGVDYLVTRVEDGNWLQPSPIGLYFASLWYAERLYPVIWTLEALGRYAAVLRPGLQPR